MATINTSNSIGVFREGEIDGKPFHIFTFSSQTFSSVEAATDSSGGNDHSLFLCPTIRRIINSSKRRENDGSRAPGEFIPCNTSPHFHNIGSVDLTSQILFGPPNRSIICKLPLPLVFFSEDMILDKRMRSTCGSCGKQCTRGNSYYICNICQKLFHKECVEAPLEIKHPSYPFHSLHYSTVPDLERICISCKEPVYDMVYQFPTFTMHPFCAMKPIPILIDHPKRHPHSLTFFPKQNSLACNVCGVVNLLFPTYVCARCVFVVHQDCINFPYVIRISRHEHRISFTYSLPSGKLSCGVCRRKVDNDYGAYSCNKCDDYFVHSRCAVRRDVWDGEELEGVPEEPEITVEPFEKIADGIILHFTHGHHLKLEMSRVYDDDKFCQACVLPIYEGNYYSCVDECDFVLHEVCANFPLKKHHPLHAHSLALKVDSNGYNSIKGMFRCDACQRYSGGFVYECPTNDFRLDVRCASVSEPFKYGGHEHPLFLSLDLKEEGTAVCRICQGDNKDIYHRCRKLNCIECDYIICFKCATLPYKARYKHDKHFLTLREGKEASEELGWCEVCELQMVYSREQGFYSCDDYCCTTLHVDCLLGKDPYMKPGQILDLYIEHDRVNVLRNNAMSRPFCTGRFCEVARCLYKVFFENKNMIYCSYDCVFRHYNNAYFRR